MESHRRANIKLVLPEVSGEVELGTESNCQGLGVGGRSCVSIGDDGEMVLVLSCT